MKEFNVFGIATKVENFSHAGKNFKTIRDISTYGDESLYLSKKSFLHNEDSIRFRYRYAIESCTLADNGPEKTYYYLYLVPEYESLSENRKRSVAECTSDDPETTDVFDYGLHVLMGSECIDGGFDKSVVDCIANVVDFIDNMRGFYLDRYQNRLGSTGWDYLYDFVKDVDCFKAALDRFKS